MPLSIRDGGTWRTINEVHVRDGGVWRRIHEIYVNDSGIWRRVFIGDQITLADRNVTDFAISPNSAFAGYELQADGDIQLFVGASSTDVGDWITPKINMADYQVRATLLSGTAPSGTLNTWMQLNANRSWSVARNTLGSTTSEFRVEIRRASDLVVVGSAIITLHAEVET